MSKDIYNPYTQDQRAQYIATRKAAIALRPDITGAQFDATVRKDFAPQSPEDWCRGALTLLATIRAQIEANARTTVSDYFGVAK